jgi:hypothetical protein
LKSSTGSGSRKKLQTPAGQNLLNSELSTVVSIADGKIIFDKSEIVHNGTAWLIGALFEYADLWLQPAICSDRAGIMARTALERAW